MTKANTRISVADHEYPYIGPGEWYGVPSVRVYLDTDKGNYTVKSLKNQFSQWGWLEKLQGNRECPLRIAPHLTGEPGKPPDPVYRKYEEEIVDLVDVLRPETTVLETRGVSQPTQDVDSQIDDYIIYLDAEELDQYNEETDEAMDWFTTHSRYYDRVHFYIEATRYKNRGPIMEFSKGYTVPDEHIWVTVGGETGEEVRENYEPVERFVKQGQWNLSPNHHLLLESLESESEESEADSEEDE